MASSNLISDLIKPCKEDACIFANSIMEGACPVSEGFPCFVFAEACRLRSKHVDFENEEIVDIIHTTVTRGLRKDLRRPDNPQAYLRTISVNLARKLIKKKIRDRSVFDRSILPEEYEAFGNQLELSGIGGDAVANCEFALAFLELVPSEARFPQVLSTRDFVILYAMEGHKPKDLIRLFPEITLKEIKHHQHVFRQTAAEVRELLKKF